MPQAAMPQAVVPQAAMPQAAMPQVVVPQAAMPQVEMLPPLGLLEGPLTHTWPEHGSKGQQRLSPSVGGASKPSAYNHNCLVRANRV